MTVAQVSSLGRFRVRHRSGRWITKTGKPEKDGYVRIYYKGKKRRVHAMVCRSFHGRRPSAEHTPHHVNHVRHDNRSANLRWASPSEQQQESHRVNKQRKNNVAKISKKLFARPVGGTTWTEYASQSEVAKALGIGMSSVSTACRAESGLGVACGYEFRRAQDETIQLMDGEELREVECYRVTNFGRILGGNNKYSYGSVRSDGYMGTSRNANEGMQQNTMVHILVCTAWHGPRPSPTHTVHHKDGDKQNNNKNNLCWATPSEQIQSTWDDNPDRKTNAASIATAVRARPAGTEEEWSEYESQNAAASALGVTAVGISACVTGVQASTGGFEFELVEAETLEGEEWRDVVLCS